MNPKYIIIPILIAIVLATFTSARIKETSPEPEENSKAERVIVLEEKSLKNEFSASSFEPYDVPLSEELQLYIFELSERYSLPIELIIAVIGQESNYNPSKIGDDGDAYGLMQVQPKWHQKRMEKFNIHEKDLLNPYANVLIGVDYLAECIDSLGIEYGLIAYNAGPDDGMAAKEIGDINEYAESVIYLSENL